MSGGDAFILGLGALSVCGLILVACGFFYAIRRPAAAVETGAEETAEELRELHVVLRGISHAEMIRVLQANPRYRAEVLRAYATADDPWQPSAELIDVHLRREPESGELQQAPPDEAPPGR